MLVLATEEQKLDRDRAGHSAWGQRLTVSEFVDRERHLRGHAFAQEGLSTWLLLGADNQILSSCETFRLASFLHAVPGQRENGASYGIASVLTEPHLRGRGYAARLMSLVMERVRALDPAAHACILFSDVGVDLYGRVGYVARPAEDLILAPAALDTAPSVQPIGEHEVETALVSIPLPDARFAVWPTPAQMDWQLERERVYSSVLGRTRPDACGARTDGAVALWTCDFKADKLVVLLLHAESSLAAERVLGAACRAARGAGLLEVVHWECPPPFSPPDCPPFGSRRDREGSIPMIKPLDARVSPCDWTVIPRGIWL